MTNSKHPFEKLFDKAIKNSFGDENDVLRVALKLREKGYNFDELLLVLTKLQHSLINDDEAEVVQDAIDAFELSR